MQDKYACDIGDYVKLSILRALAPGRRLGLGWWLHPDEHHKNDGNRIAYLEQAEKWRAYDPDIFDHLKSLVDRQMRHVVHLPHPEIFPHAVSFIEPIPLEGDKEQRARARAQWFHRFMSAVHGCDLVFLDPDNGLSNRGLDLGAKGAGKGVSIPEVAALRSSGRTLVVYHHQTRMAGGATVEMDYWARLLRDAGFEHVDAFRSSAFASRFFFVLDGTPQLRRISAAFAEKWRGKLFWAENLGL